MANNNTIPPVESWRRDTIIRPPTPVDTQTIETMTFEELQDLAAEYGLNAVRIEGGRPDGLTPMEARTAGVPRQTETEYAISEIEGSSPDIEIIRDFLMRHVEQNNIRQQPVDVRIEKLKGDLERDKEALAALESDPRAAGTYSEYTNQTDNLTNRIRRNETTLKGYEDVWERTGIQRRQEQQQAQQIRSDTESAVYRNALIQDAKKFIPDLTRRQEEKIAKVADILSEGGDASTTIRLEFFNEPDLQQWNRSRPTFQESIQEYYGAETAQAGLRSTVLGLEDELRELTAPGVNAPQDLLNEIRNELTQTKKKLRAPVPQIQVEPWTSAADLPELTDEQAMEARQAIRTFLQDRTFARAEDITESDIKTMSDIIARQYQASGIEDFTTGKENLAFIHAVLGTELPSVDPELRAKITEYRNTDEWEEVMNGLDAGFFDNFSSFMEPAQMPDMDMVRNLIISGYKDRGAWPPETTDDLDAFIRTDVRKIFAQARDNATSGGTVDIRDYRDEIQRMASERTENVSQTGLMNSVREWKANEYRATLTGRGDLTQKQEQQGKLEEKHGRPRTT